MKKSLFQRVLCLILSVTTILGIFTVNAVAARSEDQDFVESNNTTASTKEEMTALVGIPTYSEYLEKYEGLGGTAPTENLTVDLLTIVPEKSDVDDEGNFLAKPVSDSKECEGYTNSDTLEWANFGDVDASQLIYLPAEAGTTTWEIAIPNGAQGFYNIQFKYYSCKIESKDGQKGSSVSTIERKLLINGVSPFKEASYITFDKTWSFDYGTAEEVIVEYNSITPDGQYVTYETREDGYFKVITTVKDGVKKRVEYEISQDITGNSMLPQAIQTPDWHTYTCKDATGYNEGNFMFYFGADAVYQISLETQREPIILKSITLVPAQTTEIDSYSKYLEKVKAEGYNTGKGNTVRLEAEFPDMVADSSIYATNDNSSSANYPASANSQLYNIIGENSYSTVGQWAAYKFTVNEKGLYKLGMRFLQNQLEGMYVCRSIKISGGRYGNAPENPFVEAKDIRYDYSKEWTSEFLNDGATEFLFAFDAGVEYTIYFECSLGIHLKNIISEVEDILEVLNGYYLRILQLTGSSPDEYRDYGFMNIMPDVVVGFLEQGERLEAVMNHLVELSGTTGSHTATLDTIYKLLDTMGSDYGDNIAGSLSNFKSYLGTLGTWINDSKKGTLYVDVITITPADYSAEELPEAEVGFFESLWFEITSFVYSFFTDYESMGLTKRPEEGSAETIHVWLASGRDQSNIWRTMIDAENGFSDKTGYGVSLKLVTGGTLLPSILSGKGPHVYMGLGASEVINYAIREAVVGINGADTRYFNEENGNLEDNKVFTTTSWIYKDASGNYHYDAKSYAEAVAKAAPGTEVFTSDTFKDVEADNYVKAATDTLELGGVVYGVPQTMGFSMMFYRMDVLAELDLAVPETWNELLSILPTLQSNNMEIGVSHTLALEFMIYQKGGSMWRYENAKDKNGHEIAITDKSGNKVLDANGKEVFYPDELAGAAIGLDSDVALESFEFVCRLYSDYSFPVSYDAANRFRTGEMPIVVGDYASIYNTLTVYATELGGLWEFCPLPGSELYDENGDPVRDEETGLKVLNYNSLASVSATVLLNGIKGKSVKAAWAYLQWQTSAAVQANYGNKMVALIGPSAKYEAANKNAIKDLSWTANEIAAIEDQMEHLSSIVNYPGSYIMGRYMGFAFLDAVNDGADPVDSLTRYIDTINKELTRKRMEFDLPTTDPEDKLYQQYKYYIDLENSLNK